MFLGKNLLAAAAAFSAVAIVVRRRVPGTDGTMHLAMSVMAVIAMQIAWIHYQSGIFMVSELPDLDLNLKAALDLIQIAAVSVTAAVVASRERRPKEPRAIG